MADSESKLGPRHRTPARRDCRRRGLHGRRARTPRPRPPEARARLRGGARARRSDGSLRPSPPRPACRGLGELVLEPFDPADVARVRRSVRRRLPRAAARGERGAPRKRCSARASTVVDLSAAFRLKEAASYEAWYGHRHATDLSQKAVYGLPGAAPCRARGRPAHRDAGLPRDERPFAAWPRCCGETRSPRRARSSATASSSIRRRAFRAPVAVRPRRRTFPKLPRGCVLTRSRDRHRHTPEIEQELFDRGRALPCGCCLTPHLVPMTRGLLATCYAAPVRARRPTTCREAARDFYAVGW